MKHLIKVVKPHILFIVILITILGYVFYPVLNIDFLDWDWMEAEYYLKYIPPPQKTFEHIKFYLTDPYGMTYSPLGVAEILFGTSVTAFYILNVILRAIAAVGVYLLAYYWSSKRITGIIAGIYFAVAMPGIENTTWVVQFVAYIAVFLLCLSLFFWKKFHDTPSVQSLKLSVAFFSLALFLSHIRLHSLPFIILAGEIYYLKSTNKTMYQKKLMTLHFYGLIMAILVFFLPYVFFNTKAAPQVIKIVPPFLILQALINGYPPIIYTLFRYITNLFFTPTVLETFTQYAKLNVNLLSLNILSLIMVLISTIFGCVNIIKHNFKIALASLIAILYPLSFLIVSVNLSTWNYIFLISTLIGGTEFILITLALIMYKKYDYKLSSLGLFGNLILVVFLIIPWTAYPHPQIEGVVQSATDPQHRYYIVPLVGMSLIWGSLLTISWESLKASLRYKATGMLNYLKLSAKFLSYIAVFLFVIGLIIFQAETTKDWLTTRARSYNKARDIQLWTMIKPFFIKLDQRYHEKVVYFEGDLNAEDHFIISDLLRHRLTMELGFTRSSERNYAFSGAIYTVYFIDDKEKIKKLFSGSQDIYKELGLSEPFSKNRFLALRINKNIVEDITSQIFSEVKSE